MAINVNTALPDEYTYARKRADQLLYRCLDTHTAATTAASSAATASDSNVHRAEGRRAYPTSCDIITPALCSTSNYFFLSSSRSENNDDSGYENTSVCTSTSATNSYGNGNGNGSYSEDDHGSSDDVGTNEISSADTIRTGHGQQGQRRQRFVLGRVNAAGGANVSNEIESGDGSGGGTSSSYVYSINETLSHYLHNIESDYNIQSGTRAVNVNLATGMGVTIRPPNANAAGNSNSSHPRLHKSERDEHGWRMNICHEADKDPWMQDVTHTVNELASIIFKSGSGSRSPGKFVMAMDMNGSTSSSTCRVCPENDTKNPIHIIDAKEQFHQFGSTLPKKVCQHPFKRNDIVWVCRTCQADETCVLCHACYDASDHTGHDVAFYHAQAGGCCDCGDKDAWDPKGFCPLHGKDEKVKLEEGLEQRAKGLVDCCVEYLGLCALNIERAYSRANNSGKSGIMPGKRKLARSRTSSLDGATMTAGNNMTGGGEMGRRTHDQSQQQQYERMVRRSHSTAADGSISDQYHGNTDDNNEHNNEEASGTSGDEVLETSANVAVSSEHILNMNPISSDVSMGVVGSGAVSVLSDPSEECKFDPTAAGTSKSRSGIHMPSSDKDETSSGSGSDQQTMDESASAEFDPQAASASKSRDSSRKMPESKNMTPAQYLGLLGSQQQGLYLLLHADDVHTTLDVTNALRTLYISHPQHSVRNLDSISSKIANLLNNQEIGDLIVWGTQELMDELGPVLSSCWKDEDPTACTRFGALILEKAKILSRFGMVVSIKTRGELCKEIRCAAVQEFLNLMSGSCDALCRLVSVGLGAKETDSDTDEDVEEFESDGDMRMKDEIDSGASSAGPSANLSMTINKGSRSLFTMLRSDLKLPRRLAKSWHELLLTLLAVPNFKAALANAYVDTYNVVTGEYAHGIGIFEKSSYTLSVQFLNRVVYVEDLVKERDLLGCLVRSLYETLSVAIKAKRDSMDESIKSLPLTFFGDNRSRSATWTINMIHDVLDDYLNPLGSRTTAQWRGIFSRSDSNEPEQRTHTKLNPVLDPLHPVLSHRRYGPCISDLKCVLNVPGIARLFSSIPTRKVTGHSSPSFAFQRPCLLDAWINTLSLGQNMDGQRWRRVEEGHVEQEPRDWVGAFNAGISIGSLFERLLSWEDDDQYKECSLFEEFRKTNTFLSVVELSEYIIMKGIFPWQSSEIVSFTPTTKGPIAEYNCPTCLPLASVAADHGAPLAMKSLPVAQSQLWSFHLPLHRFVAACLREVSRRPYQRDDGKLGSIEELVANLKQHEEVGKLYRTYYGLLEYPIIVLARNAQIRSDLWLRNGRGMQDQVLNYAEPPFCRGLRDADLILIQFASIGLMSLTQAELDSAVKTEKPRNAVFTCAHLINLLLNRFGVFDFTGLVPGVQIYQERYWAEIGESLYPPEKQMDNETKTLPWTYSPTDDPVRCKSMLEEFFHTLIILITELLTEPPVDKADHSQQAKLRLRREVIHRLASGPKAHSELSEVHHVLPMKDNVILSEEGKLVNPDDATGAALEAALVEVADCKSFQGKSDKWELQRWAWNEYDPAFFHISQRQHQNASESRPSGLDTKHRKITPTPYAPFPPVAHRALLRLRRDVTSDATVIATLYRALHVHCRTIKDGDDLVDKINGKKAYGPEAMSETILGRVVHLLTLGVYAWEGSSAAASWKSDGGGGTGSVFHDLENTPTHKDWVNRILLQKPELIMGSNAYSNEENALLLLHKLTNIGGSDRFKVQDRSIRCGAAWICEYATRNSPEAAKLLGDNNNSLQSKGIDNAVETDLQRRRREAKERIMKKMQEKMTNFAKSIDVANNDSDRSDDKSPNAMLIDNADDICGRTTELSDPGDMDTKSQSTQISGVAECGDGFESNHHLFKECPRCIICGDDGTLPPDHKEELSRKPKVLTFIGYIQASTVVKDGGGIPSKADNESQHLVGTHVSLCGHAIHASCCDSHLKDSSQREDRLDRLEGGRRGEFKCPLCRRLSNCLVPFIDVDKGWAHDEEFMSKVKYKSSSSPLQDFLSNSRWWTARNDDLSTWNGRCSFIPKVMPNDTTRVKIFGKKDLCRAWSTVLFSPPRSGLELNHSIEDSPGRSGPGISSSTAATDVWRRILDQVSEISYKADSKRIGEERLQKNLGEFRHYLIEKVAYNEENIDSSIAPPTFWPACMIPLLSPDKRQELSREKLISKHFLSIQALTYSCCSEVIECIRLAKMSTSDAMLGLFAKFGIDRFACNGRFIIMSNDAKKDGSVIFNGKFGKLRCFALAVSVATGPLAREVVHLCMDLPDPKNPNPDIVFPVKRAPLVFPILCSHVLTHVVAAMCATCGEERIRSETDPTCDKFGDEATLNCIHFVQLGFIARVLQILLAEIVQAIPYSQKWETILLSELNTILSRNNLSQWEKGCCRLLHIALSQSISTDNATGDLAHIESLDVLLLNICQTAKDLVVDFIYNAAIILQVLLPKSIILFDQINGSKKQSDDELRDLTEKLGIHDLERLVESQVLFEVISNWFQNSRPKYDQNRLEKRLDCNRIYKSQDWPNVIYNDMRYSTSVSTSRIAKKTLPLLRGSFNEIGPAEKSTNSITALPISYTDLYASLGSMSPNSEVTAVCLVCGEVLDAGGKGECTKHAYVCGGGCGLFFLLQECVGLALNKERAAYIASPYVDSHGETPQYRGRPLNMDISRYEHLHELWSGHMLREYVIAERLKSPRNTLITPNFY